MRWLCSPWRLLTRSCRCSIVEIAHHPPSAVAVGRAGHYGACDSFRDHDIHARHPHRDRHVRPDRGAGRPLLGRAGAALARQFQDRLGKAAAVRGARARHRQARRGGSQHGAGAARPGDRRGDRQGGAGGDRRQARRPLPAGRLADRLGHAVQHERQRGDLQPGDRDARRRDGLEEAGPSQRPRQHEPVVERHLSDGHAHRLCRAHRPRPAAGAEASARGARGEGGRVRPHRQDRPHAHAGRDAADARPGVLRLRRAGRLVDQAHRADAAGAVRAGAGRHRGRHRPQRAGRLRRAGRRQDRRDHRHRLRHRAQQVRGARRA